MPNRKAAKTFTSKENLMNTAVGSWHEWSAKKLGWLMSILGCTTCAVIAIAVMVMFLPPSRVVGNSRWLDLLVVVFLSYLQLVGSKLHRSPIERKGDMVKGMIFGELGDDDIHVSVRRWTWFWFFSPLIYSLVFTAVGLLLLYYAIGPKQP